MTVDSAIIKFNPGVLLGMPKLDVVSDDRQSHLLRPVVLKGISRTYR